MPRKDSIIEKMQGAFWYSCLDLLNFECEIVIYHSQHFRPYEYLVLPMGLSNAPATFNEGIRRILADLSGICQCYVDGIYIYPKSTDIDDHLEALGRVLTRLEENKFHVKLSKCIFVLVKYRVLEITLVVKVLELIQK
ncbi:Gag/polymerase/env Polyprotein [Phytophthora palmivora]|uniref:Gag/polymerase/env Polyprotein n=1 Tax=Phytophthora palmivora TaxID=4796 RepID=A0A2P4XK68_9STRA|nr:Gag/polymerase/env Polyprotein [Phytophthora palmivora]